MFTQCKHDMNGCNSVQLGRLVDSLRITSGVIPADFLTVNMPAEPFRSTSFEHWWDSNSYHSV